MVFSKVRIQTLEECRTQSPEDCRENLSIRIFENAERNLRRKIGKSHPTGSRPTSPKNFIYFSLIIEGFISKVTYLQFLKIWSWSYCECLTSWPVFLRSEMQRGRVGGAIIIFCACVQRVLRVVPYRASRWTYRGGPMTAKRHARESSS